ncbi:MAG: hypothetical protein QOF27_714 [Gaiellaceae bacterium]|jgi:hypothetical protein|nr:hypothetical protein [Gaiellaceae bacterium]
MGSAADNRDSMPIHVRISQPSLLADLIESLLNSNCAAHPVGDNSCLVVHGKSGHPDEALIELTFFVRAWQIRYPGLATVVTL